MSANEEGDNADRSRIVRLETEVETLSRQSETSFIRVFDLLAAVEDKIQRQGKFPIGTIISFAGLAFVVIVALAGGYIGKPQARIEANLKELRKEFHAHELKNAYDQGKADAESREIYRRLNNETQ